MASNPAAAGNPASVAQASQHNGEVNRYRPLGFSELMEDEEDEDEDDDDDDDDDDEDEDEDSDEEQS